MSAKKPIVIPERETVWQAPRDERGHELLNPEYRTDGINALHRYLTITRGIIEWDPVPPTGMLDEKEVRVLPRLFMDNWNFAAPNSHVRVELLRLQIRDPDTRFQDLLSEDEERIVRQIVLSEVDRRGGEVTKLFHRSGMPTPLDLFPLEMFEKAGFPTADLWVQPHVFHERRRHPLPRDKRPPTHLAVTAWVGFDFVARENVYGSNGTMATLKGFAFAQAIRRALLVAWQLQPRKEIQPLFHIGHSWYSELIRDYFDVPRLRSLRWYSWIADPLFYLLEEIDDWAWHEFNRLVEYLGWRREDAILSRDWPASPENEAYASLKKDILAEATRNVKPRLKTWFSELERLFLDALHRYGDESLNVHWYLRDGRFVIPCLLLQLYRPTDYRPYLASAKKYLAALQRCLAGNEKRGDRYRVWEYEMMCEHDPFRRAFIIWEFGVGSEDLLFKLFTPPKRPGRPYKYEATRFIQPILYHFSGLRDLGVNHHLQRSMQICNGLVSADIYPPESEKIFDRAVRRAVEEQAANCEEDSPAS